MLKYEASEHMVWWPAMCMSTAITDEELFIRFFSFFTTGLTSSESESAGARFSFASASRPQASFACFPIAYELLSALFQVLLLSVQV